METSSPGQRTMMGGPLQSAEEMQYEEDLRKAIEESLKTQEEEDKRRKFLGYDKPDSSPREPERRSSRETPTTNSQRISSPPDLMSFKFDHVMNKFPQNDTEKLAKKTEGMKAAGILSGRLSVSSSTPYQQTSKAAFNHPFRHSIAGSKGTTASNQSVMSNSATWGDRLFQPNLAAPQVVRKSPSSPSQRNSAIWSADSNASSGNPFNSPPRSSSKPSSKDVSSGKLSSSEMMESLLKASVDSLSSSPSSDAPMGGITRGSSLRKSTTSVPLSSSGSSNPFVSISHSASYNKNLTPGNIVIADGNMRRISSQPSFQDFMSNGGSPQAVSIVATVNQSRSSEGIDTEAPSSGNNLMHFSPTGTNSDVFDFSYFDPLNSPEQLKPPIGAKPKSSSDGGANEVKATSNGSSTEDEVPPALPPRRPTSFAAGESDVIRMKNTRSHSSGHGGVSPTKSWVPSTLTRNVDPSKVFFGDGLYDINSLTDEEGVSFGRRVSRIRREFNHLDQVRNPGHVVTPIFNRAPKEEFETSVKMVLYNPTSKEKPVMFTCDVNTSVQHIIIQAVCYSAEGNLDCDPGKYCLKIPGRAEYLTNDMILGHCEYVQERRKFDQDVELVLVTQEEISVSLARTLEDDETEIDITTFTSLIDTPVTTSVSRQGLDVLIDNFTSETDKLMVALNAQHEIHKEPLIQSVKVICTTLAKVETNSITQAIQKLEYSSTKTSVENLTKAVFELIDSYCQAFDTDFNKLTAEAKRSAKAGVKDITTKGKRMAVRLDSAHRLPRSWKTSYDEFIVTLQLFYSGQPLHPVSMESYPTKVTTAFFDKLTFAHVVELPIPISQLPRESRLCFSLYGQGTNPPEKVCLGWVVVPLFNYQSVLISGTQLLGLWPNGNPNPIGTCASNLLSMESVILQVDFLNFKDELVFPSIEPMTAVTVRDYRDLDEEDRSRISRLLMKGSISRLGQAEASFLWAKRHYCHQFRGALPVILSAAPTWDWASLPEIYSLLYSWPPLEPLQAMQLLHPRFADQEIRYQAVQWMQPLPDDDLCNFLPQLVQALKYESYHNSALVSFLLRRSLSSIRIAHYLYW